MPTINKPATGIGRDRREPIWLFFRQVLVANGPLPLGLGEGPHEGRPASMEHGNLCTALHFCCPMLGIGSWRIFHGPAFENRLHSA